MGADDLLLIGIMAMSILTRVAYEMATPLYFNNDREAMFSLRFFLKPAMVTILLSPFCVVLGMVTVLVAIHCFIWVFGISLSDTWFSDLALLLINVMMFGIPVLIMSIQIRCAKQAIHKIVDGNKVGIIHAFPKTTWNLMKSLFAGEVKYQPTSNCGLEVWDSSKSYYVEIFDEYGTYISTVILKGKPNGLKYNPAPKDC